MLYKNSNAITECDLPMRLLIKLQFQGAATVPFKAYTKWSFALCLLKFGKINV